MKARIIKLVTSGKVKENTFRIYSVNGSPLIQVSDNMGCDSYKSIPVEKIRVAKI